MRQKNPFSIKPLRLIWNETGPDHVKAEDDTLKHDFAEGMKTIDFANQAQQTCNMAKEAGKGVVDQRVCDLNEAKEYTELLRTRTFVDELYQRFLVEGEGYKKGKDTYARFRTLKKECDMDAILKLLAKAESYEIKTHKGFGKEPDKIIFTRADGTQQEYNLELSEGEKSIVFRPFWYGLKSLQMNSGNAEESEDEEESENEEETGMEEGIEKYSKKVFDIIAQSRQLNSSKEAYNKITELAPSFPDDLSDELSEPLAEYMDIVSRGEFDGKELDLPEGGNSRAQELLIQIQDIFNDHLGEGWKRTATEDQMREIRAIGDAFGMA